MNKRFTIKSHEAHCKVYVFAVVLSVLSQCSIALPHMNQTLLVLLFPIYGGGANPKKDNPPL